MKDVSTATTWKQLLKGWASIYTVLPNKILVYQGRSFGNLFIDLSCTSNVEIHRTGIETHSSLGTGERYHQPLRKTYRKIVSQNPNLDQNLFLSISVK